MKFSRCFLAILITLNSGLSFAQSKEKSLQLLSERVESQRDWPTFEKELENYRESQGLIGMSYVASGAAVSIGGLIGQQTTMDTASRFVFGISQSLGLLAVGYGMQVLMAGNEYESFYSALRSTDLSTAQRDNMVRVYLERERDRREILRKVAIGTHVLISGFNFYAAGIERENSTRAILNGLGILNLTIAAAYCF